MLARILKGYLGILGSLGRFVLLGAACVAAGFAVAYPLWLLATERPMAYTAVCGALFAIVAGTIAFSRMRTARRLDPARFRRGIAKFAVLAAGLSGSVVLVLRWHRVLALLVLLATAVLWGALAFVPPKSRSGEDK